jgi:hypothetical protein
MYLERVRGDRRMVQPTRLEIVMMVGQGDRILSLKGKKQKGGRNRIQEIDQLLWEPTDH